MNRLSVRVSTLFLILIIFCIVIGCTSSQTSTRELRTGTPAVERTIQPGTTPRTPPTVTLPADKGADPSPTAGGTSRSLPQVTRAADRDASPVLSHTIPATSTIPATLPASASANLQEITAMLTSLSDAWDITGTSCDTTSCTGTFVSGEGQTLTIKVTVYPDSNTAKQAYSAEKSAHQGPTTVDLTYGDASFAYTGRSGSGAVLLQGPFLVTMTLTSPTGIPTTSDLSSVVKIVSASLPSG